MELLKDYTKTCSFSLLKDREGKRFIINDREIAVFKVDEKIYAVSNLCPHQHTPNIYDGYVEEGCVVCPIHGWMFSLETGKMRTGGKGLETFPVEIKDGSVYVKVLEKELKW